jgi:hypothetical protein
MVSIWLTRVKGGGESSARKKSASARIPQKWPAGFAIRIRAILAGAFSCGKPASTLPEKAPYAADFLKNAVGAERRLLAILLDPGGAQPRKAMLVDGKLPGQEFVDGQRIAAASLLKGEQAAANRRNDFGLATDDPSLGSGCGQIRNR